MPPPKLVAAARPNVRVSKLQLCRWISCCFFFFRPKDKEQRCIPSERKSCNHSLGPSDLIGKMCGGTCYLYREPPNMFKCEVRSPSFLLSKGFLDTICRAQPCADCKCLWERPVWNQIKSCTFNVTLRQKMLVILPVTFPLAVLTTSEVYSGSLEADMSENHPTYSSVKWEVLPFFSLRVSWMQSAGLGHVQVTSVYGKGSFESRSQAAPLQASTGWNIHESPWLMIPIRATFLSQDMWHCGRRCL